MPEVDTLIMYLDENLFLRGVVIFKSERHIEVKWDGYGGTWNYNITNAKFWERMVIRCS
jgi:hypothetical protein